MGGTGREGEGGTKLDDVGAEVVESAFAEEEAAPEAGLSQFGVWVEEPDGAVGGLLALVRLGVECFLLELGLLADFVAYFVEEVGGGVFPLPRRAVLSASPALEEGGCQPAPWRGLPGGGGVGVGGEGVVEEAVVHVAALLLFVVQEHVAQFRGRAAGAGGGGKRAVRQNRFPARGEG